MAERRVKVPFGNPEKLVDAVEVSVDESTEKWSEFTLSDGTLVRGKMTVISAARIDGEYDPQGNPMYAMNLAPTFVILSAPEALRRKSK